VQRERGAPASMGAVVVLVAVIMLFLTGVEIFTRKRIISMSRIESREQNEYRAAVAARPSRDRKTVLMLGNSLMGEGVRADEVRAALGPEWDLTRIFIEDTAYYDFFYGMRRLYAEGARFTSVLVFLTPRQLILRRVRGDYFAYRLMLGSDVLNVARDTGLNRTDASDLLFARLSAFYGLRSEIRKVLLGKLLPDLPSLMSQILSGRPSPLTNQEIYGGALENLRAFRELATAQDSRIILVLPPQLEPEGVDLTELAASQAGISTVTVPRGLTGPSDFRDGFHLNDDGARKYTAALIPAIKQVLH